jgi:hypothetical protein
MAQGGDDYLARLGRETMPPAAATGTPAEEPRGETRDALDLPRPPSAPPPPGEFTRIISTANAAPHGSVPGATPGYPTAPGYGSAAGGIPGFPPSGMPLPAIPSVPGVPLPGLPPLQPPLQPAAPAAAGPSRRLLIGGLVVIVVLATALIIYFALAGGSTEAPPLDGDAVTAPAAAG